MRDCSSNLRSRSCCSGSLRCDLSAHLSVLTERHRHREPVYRSDSTRKSDSRPALPALHPDELEASSTKASLPPSHLVGTRAAAALSTLGRPFGCTKRKPTRSAPNLVLHETARRRSKGCQRINIPLFAGSLDRRYLFDLFLGERLCLSRLASFDFGELLILLKRLGGQRRGTGSWCFVHAIWSLR